MTVAFIITSTILVLNTAFSISSRMQLKEKEKEVMQLRKNLETYGKQANANQKERTYHRVQLKDSIPCQVHLVDFGTNKLNRLKDRTFKGTIHDISLGGLCLRTEIALPVQFSILAEIEFTVDGLQFTLPCEFVRKVGRKGTCEIMYGVQFQKLNGSDEHRLALLINRMELQNRKNLNVLHPLPN